MGSILLFMTHNTESWFEAAAFLRVKNLALSITLGIIIYVFVCMLAGLKKHDFLRGSK
jgi:hypothetical protein